MIWMMAFARHLHGGEGDGERSDTMSVIRVLR